jgi:lysophospholipase L1-like esterase
MRYVFAARLRLRYTQQNESQEAIVLQSISISLLLLGVLAACASAGSNPTPAPTSTSTPTRTPAPTPTTLPPLLIVTLGDSLTWGDKDDEPGGWPRRLLPLVQAVRPQTHIVNLALPGWTSRDLLQGRDGAPNQIDQAVKVLREASGDKIATLWIGVNDLFYLYEYGDPTEAEEAQEADRFARDLDELLGRLLDTGARVFVALLHDPSRGSVQTSGVFMSTSGEEWAQMSQQAQRFNEIIRAAAVKRSATLVDVATIFSAPAWMFEDGIHPNARGYDELTRVWWNALRDAVIR